MTEQRKAALNKISLDRIENLLKEVVRIGDLPVKNSIRLDLSNEARLLLSFGIPEIRAALSDKDGGEQVQQWVTVRNESTDRIIVEVNGTAVINDFYVSGETELNHGYNMTDLIAEAQRKDV